MKNPLKNQRFFAVVLSVLISVFLVAVFVYAATTIGSNITTGGTLSVTGASSFSTASTTGNFWLGNQTADDDDYLYMDASSTEYLMWDDSPGQFVFSDDLDIQGNATATGNFIVGASSWAVPTSTLTVVGTAYINNKATTSHAFWIGTGGTIDNLDLDGGDLYVQDDAEIDGESFLTGGARISTLNATTTNIGTLTVFTAVTLPDGSIQWADIGDVPTSTTDDLPEGSSNLYYTDARWDTRFIATTTWSGDLTVDGKATTTDTMVINSGIIATTTVTFGNSAGTAGVGVCFKFFNGDQVTYCYASGGAWVCSGTSCE